MQERYGKAATGMVSGQVAMCISIKSICPMSLPLFKILGLIVLSKLFKANFVVSEILALFSGTCLCTCMLLGITRERYQLVWVIHEFYLQLISLLLDGVQLVLMVIGFDVICFTSLMDMGCTGGIMLQLRGIISPMCLFLGHGKIIQGRY